MGGGPSIDAVKVIDLAATNLRSPCALIGLFKPRRLNRRRPDDLAKKVRRIYRLLRFNPNKSSVTPVPAKPMILSDPSLRPELEESR